MDKFFNWLMYGLIGTAIVIPGSSQSATLLTDSFEYADSPAAHGWTVTGNANEVFTTTDQAFDGQRSVRLDHVDQPYFSNLIYSFGDVAIDGTLEFSVQFYDELIAGFNFDVIASAIFDGGTAGAGIGWYNQPNYVVFFGNTELESIIARSTGWHEFKWIVEDGLADLFIDSVLVQADLFAAATLTSIKLDIGTEEPLAAYFDDVNVTLAPVPLPAALPLFVTALGGMGMMGWRRKRKTSPLT